MSFRQNYVPAERQEKILQYIRQHGSGQIRALSEWLEVSEATVRRDLDDLHHAGYIERTHGGAIYNRAGTSFERQYEEKLTLMEAEKRRIAGAAAALLSPGDTLFLDSGTTSYYLGCALSGIPHLTVFTYDLMVAYSIALHPSSQLIVSGGIRRPGYNNVLLGSQVIGFLRDLRVDKVFLGADAVDLDFGVSNSNFQEAEIKAQAVSSGEKVVLLADSTKFEKVALSRVCGLDQIDALITDDGIDPQLQKSLEGLVDQVIVA